MTGKLLVGTSSWADPGFVDEWYPQGMPAGERLPWYAERFELVELNSSFYAVPDVGTVERWVTATPPGFTFDVKLHRLLSRHSAEISSLPPDLRDGAETTGRGRVRLTAELERALLERILEAVAPLAQGGRLGAFLLQLTPAFAPGKHRLEELDTIMRTVAPHPVAVEFRHRGWVEPKRIDETLDYLGERSAAFVAVDAPPGDHVPIMPPVDAVTRADLAYIRMHGRNTEGYLKGRSVAERFAWKYSDGELREIAGRAEQMAAQAEFVHVLFNNNRGADAPSAAQRFRELVGQRDGSAQPARQDQLRLG